jgi:hypothetical protein
MELPVTVTRMSPEREHALVAQARSGGAAFEELYDFYLPRIYGFIYRRVQERSVAEDLTATTSSARSSTARGPRSRVKVHRALRALRGAMAEGTTDAA